MYGIGTNELLIIGGIILLLFGGSKLTQFGKGLGDGIREFRTSMAPPEPTEQTPSSTSDSTKKEA